MAAKAPLIAVISAVEPSVEPARAALVSQLPNAQVWNLIDDRLLIEAREHGAIDDALSARMNRLIDHAVASGADGVLVTCSVYSGAVRQHAAEVEIPVLPSDDAGFRTVLESGASRVLLVTPIPEALADSTERLTAAAHQAGVAVEIVGVVAEGAHQANLAGTLDELITGVIRSVERPYDAVLLGQYSLAPAAAAVREAFAVPVFTTPDAAAQEMSARLLRR